MNFSGATSTDEGTATSAQVSAGSGDADLYFRVHACGAWSNTHHATVFGGGGGGLSPNIATAPRTASGSGIPGTP